MIKIFNFKLKFDNTDEKLKRYLNIGISLKKSKLEINLFYIY